MKLSQDKMSQQHLSSLKGGKIHSDRSMK